MNGASAKAAAIALRALPSLALFFGALQCRAETYRVGPGERYAVVSQIASKLRPGDSVVVTGDIEDSFELTVDGTRLEPITIRGEVRIDNGGISRPRLHVDNRALSGIVCKGDWYVIEGLDISAAKRESGTRSAVLICASHIVVRNCFIHANTQGVDSVGMIDDLTIEFCEFEANGSGDQQHTIYLTTLKPHATATLANCYIHDAAGGHMFKSRFPRNIVRYNWFESPIYSILKITDKQALSQAEAREIDNPLYPMHSDIVGNVFFMGWSPGSRYSTLQLGGEDVTIPGTEGDFNIAHNLFIITRSDAETHGVAALIHGNVDRVNLYNNVMLPLGVGGMTAYERDMVWESPRTAAFRERRGHGEPIVEGANNWVSVKTIGIPESFVNTLRGVNPHFVDLINFDFRPAKDSPLAGAGLWPLPQGRIVELVPEYEPQRGIPADLTPTPRRKVSPPSVGPFEALE